MPANIYLSQDQIRVLAETESDVVVNEVHTQADALDCWIVDHGEFNDNGRHEHRSMVIDADGTVLSDTMIPS